MAKLIETAEKFANSAAHATAARAAYRAKISGRHSPAEITTIAAQAAEQLVERLREATMRGAASAIDAMRPDLPGIGPSEFFYI